MGGRFRYQHNIITVSNTLDNGTGCSRRCIDNGQLGFFEGIFQRSNQRRAHGLADVKKTAGKIDGPCNTHFNSADLTGNFTNGLLRTEAAAAAAAVAKFWKSNHLIGKAEQGIVLAKSTAFTTEVTAVIINLWHRCGGR